MIITVRRWHLHILFLIITIIGSFPIRTHLIEDASGFEGVVLSILISFICIVMVYIIVTGFYLIISVTDFKEEVKTFDFTSRKDKEDWAEFEEWKKSREL